MDPVVAAKIAKVVVQQKDENKRNKIWIALVSIVTLFLFMYSTCVYIVTHPLDAAFGDHEIELGIHGLTKITDYSKTEDTVWNYLKSLGFSDCGAAGVMGNVSAESSFNTSACHSGYYYGLCQWGGGRWCGENGLKRFAEDVTKTEWTDLHTQLNFFQMECQKSYPNVYKQMICATDVKYACDYFCTKYEICIGKSGEWAYSMVDGKPYQDLEKRRRLSQQYYEHYVKKEGGGT